MRSVQNPALFGVAAALVLAAAVAGPGCGGAQDSTTDRPPMFPADALVVQTSTTGAYRVEVRTDPQPLVRGSVRAQVLVTGAADGLPVDGLTVGVLPWMPAHGHGTSIETAVTPQGGGAYLVESLYLYMGGTWELRTSLSGDAPAVQDDVVAQVQVP